MLVGATLSSATGVHYRLSQLRIRNMADPDTEDAEAPAAAAPFATPSLEDMQHWTWVMGRAQ